MTRWAFYEFYFCCDGYFLWKQGLKSLFQRTGSLFVDRLCTHCNVYLLVVIKMLMPGEVLHSKVLCGWTIAQLSVVRQAEED